MTRRLAFATIGFAHFLCELPAFDPGWHDLTPRGIRAGKLQAPLELRVGRPRR